jgi:signal transduction histidine kinase
MAMLGLPQDDSSPSRRIPFAPFRTIGILLVQFVVFALLLLGVLLVHTNQDLSTLKTYTANMIRIAEINRDCSEAWKQHGAAAAMQVLAVDLQHLPPDFAAAGEQPQLRRLQALAARGNPADLPQVFADLSAWNLAAHLHGRGLVLAAGHDSRYTLIGSVIALVAFMIFVIVTLIFFRTRILSPLRRLQGAMYSLELGAFQRVDEGRADPGITPLLRYYNQMVGRLEELEHQRRRYLQDLQREVHEAASTLMAQQAAMARSERMAAVGEAAAAFAHELRNPLAGLQVGCANLRREIADGELDARLALMEEELRRVSRLLDQQLRGARHAHESGQWVQPGEVIEALLNLLRYQLPPEISLRFSVEAQLGPCMLPVDQLRQALLNLVLNARQALDDQLGEILVELRRGDDGRISLQVADSGPGFPPTLLRDGIRPFATGREQGTGLGLAMVRRFVRSLGGEVKLANRPQGGAAVTLLIPCPPPLEESTHG